MLSTCQGYRPGDRDDVASITKLALRELATRVADLDEQIKRVQTRRHRLLRAHAPRLLAIFGVGPDTAATLLVSAGDNPDRLHSEASFAALLGASPIRASSGKTKRKRLNRGGDRQGNSALWHIVITRMATSHQGLRGTPHHRRPLTRRNHPLPQALRRPRSLQRTTPRTPDLTVGAYFGRLRLVRLSSP